MRVVALVSLTFALAASSMPLSTRPNGDLSAEGGTPNGDSSANGGLSYTLGGSGTTSTSEDGSVRSIDASGSRAPSFGTTYPPTVSYLLGNTQGDDSHLGDTVKSAVADTVTHDPLGSRTIASGVSDVGGANDLVGKVADGAGGLDVISKGKDALAAVGGAPSGITGKLGSVAGGTDGLGGKITSRSGDLTSALNGANGALDDVAGLVGSKVQTGGTPDVSMDGDKVL